MNDTHKGLIVLFAEVLHRPGKDLYMKVPVQYEKKMTLDNAVGACKDAGLVPLCKNRDEKDGDCLVMDLNSGKQMLSLIRDVCPSTEWIDNKTPKSICPEIERAFFYVNKTDANGDAMSQGVMTQDGEVKTGVWGTQIKSGDQLKPYYAACTKEGGNDMRNDNTARQNLGPL